MSPHQQGWVNEKETRQSSVAATESFSSSSSDLGFGDEDDDEDEDEAIATSSRWNRKLLGPEFLRRRRTLSRCFRLLTSAATTFFKPLYRARLGTSNRAGTR